MGTLDDAIRQHLELKRRSGATESEVDRLESEAFGPARRAAEAAAAAATPAPIAPPVDQPTADELPPPPAAAPRAAEPAAPAEPPAAPPVEPMPSGASVMGESWLDDDEEDAAAPGLPSQAPQSTSEFTAGDLTEARGGVPESDYVAPDEEGEDLLEETPEFLQETPEHDRLWFEQKPPRDFDFDQ